MEIECEVFTKKYLPAIKACMVRKFHERHHLTQVEISKLLGITQPAVSQYLNGIRGSTTVLPLQVVKKIDANVEQIYSLLENSKFEDGQIRKAYCNICEEIRRQKQV